MQQPEQRPIWTDAQDAVRGRDGRVYIDNHATIWRWREAYQHDFAARMDWCLKPYKQANHPPVAALAGPDEVQVRVGEAITLDARGSSDPDGDRLEYRWFQYAEAGTYWHWRGLALENADSPVLTLRVPEQVELNVPRSTHIILQVTDGGTPALTRYQRVVVNIMPAEK
jgi:hypothetical protein